MANLSQNVLIKNILLAEDSLEHCFFFRKTLSQSYPTIKYNEVNDGEALLSFLKSFIPDILFLDLDMPCKNGIECLNEIRNKRIYDSLPIVIYSISNRQNTIQTTYGLGANLYFIKPAEYNSLHKALEYIISLDWSNPKAVTENYFSNNKYLAFQQQ